MTVSARYRAGAAALFLAVLGFAVAGLQQPAMSSGPQSSRFVSLHGDDSARGSAAAPWRTLQHAVDQAPRGATVTVMPGRYRGFTVSGERRLTIRGAPHRRRPVLVAGPGQEGDTVRIHDAEGIALRRLVVTGASGTFNAGVEVRRSRRIRLEHLLLQHNESFGVAIVKSKDVMLRHSVLTRNDTGVQVTRSRRVRIARNDLMRNDGMVVDDAQPGNDRGANAIVVYRTPGPVQIVGNRAWGNRARSTDWGFDGGAFEIYDASRVTIRANRVWNNQNVVETGTSPGGGCRDNRFEGNIASRGRATGPAMGMILRCAERMRVVDNTFYDLDRFVFDVTADARRFGGSVEGLTITHNRAVSRRDKIYSIDSALPQSVRIDHQLAANLSGAPLAYVHGLGQARSLEQFRDWTGFEVHGRQLAPTFRSPARGDFRRACGSDWTG